MKPLTREWIEKAEEDFRVAQWVQREPVGSANAVCFHCQQCAEKYLKALLTEDGIAFPRTHDLDVLLDLAAVERPATGTLRSDLQFLSPFSVEARYPGVSAGSDEASDALAIATAFRTLTRQLLGLGNG